ncbi:hypothetical protein Mjas_03960 [Methanothermococcus sp. Ax23]|uniref:hypothetical protein n=1 Tax=Methanothermococcus sp. Ax23 TaxID=3156486 RepID=UPI003BA25332
MSLVELIYDKEEHKKRIKEDGLGYPGGVIKTIFKVNGELLGAIVWVEEGKIEGDECDLYGFFEEMLTLLPYLLSEGKYYRFSKNSQNFNLKEVKSWIDINNVKNPNLACWVSLHFQFNIYIFELDKDKDELIIHYRNDMYLYKDRAGKEGIVRVPLKDFTKEIVKLAEDYLKLLRNSEIPENDKDWIKNLEKYLADFKKYYEERYGEEL